jgi:Spy/CpxP family protein refolding chaperone
MRLRFALVSTAVLTLAASGLWAQNPTATGSGPNREAMAQRRMEALLKGITLTKEQQAKIDSIRARYQAQMPVFTAGTPPDSARREQMRDLFRRQHEEMRAVLTPDQQKVLDQNVAEMRARRPGGP